MVLNFSGCGTTEYQVWSSSLISPQHAVEGQWSVVSPCPLTLGIMFISPRNRRLDVRIQARQRRTRIAFPSEIYGPGMVLYVPFSVSRSVVSFCVRRYVGLYIIDGINPDLLKLAPLRNLYHRNAAHPHVVSHN